MGHASDGTSNVIDLKRRTALVTGGTQGVGAAIAVALARCGAKVILHGLQADSYASETLKLCQTYSPDCELCCFDLAKSIPEIRDNFLAPLLLEHPDLSIAVCNAGIFIDPSFLDITEEGFDRTMHINVKVGFFLAQALSKHWVANRIDGRLLFTGSINGLLAEPDHAAYDTSKGAVAAMVRSLCVSLAPYKIRVNSIAPGLVRTPLTNQILSTNPVALHWMQLHTPNGQVPEADVCEIGRAHV